MSNKLLFRLAVLVTAMMCALGAAAAEAYACYTPSNTTLTFYYDTQRSYRPGTTYDLNTGDNTPGWETDGTNASVTKVVFDPSFANARPTSTYRWFDNMTQLQSITGIQYLNTSNVTNMGLMFYTCSSLTSLDVSHFNTSNVTDMSWTFASCSGLTSLDVSSFNTSNVTDMHCMFSACSGLTSLDLGNFNTANVTDMGFMFSRCSGLTNLNVSSFNTAKVTNMEFMFRDCSGLTNLDVTHFNTASVTRMKNLFDGCTGLTSLDVSSFNTSNVTDMHCMFWGCSGLTSLDVTHFNTAKVTDMSLMFASCSGLTNLDVTHFNTSNVTTMARIFERCSGLTSIDVSGFNTSKVTDMSDMFYDCPALTSVDLSSFNTSNVIYMSSMFNSCSGLTSLDLSSFNTAKVTKMDFMFSECTGLTTIYVCNSWGTAAVTQSNYMFRDCTSLVGGQGTTYDANHIDATYAHIDGGPSNPGYFSEPPEAYAVYTSNNKTLTFYYDGHRTSRPGTTYDMNEGNDIPEWFNDIKTFVTAVVFDPSFDDARPQSTSHWFSNMKNLESITGMEYLHTNEVRTMKNMFATCSKLTEIDLSHFYTAYVTDMSGMFQFSNKLTSLDLSSFNTASVTTMSSMFTNCSGLTSLDLSNFNTANVTQMVLMFQNCSHLTSLDLTSFNTANVTDMRSMFYNCEGLTSLDLGQFNTANVTDMSQMFRFCIGLTTIYVGNGWNTDNVTSSSYMFSGATDLMGGQGTTYDASHTDKEYAHIDGGPSNPGYLTDINALAEPEAYACYTPSNTTLTFYYDNQRASREGTTYDLNTGGNQPEWFASGIYSHVTQVVFDPSFADARPTLTGFWFASMSNLTSITGMNYLNTSEVTAMYAMFRECSGLTTLDLSSFNTANVTNMNFMFAGCTNLTTIYVGNEWCVDAVTSSVSMFNNCPSLMGGMGTTWNESNPKDKTYAHIDGGPSNPGYFTEKVDFLRGDVNGDGAVNIADVTALIDLLLGNGGNNNPAADCNDDGAVNIADVTKLIDYLLSGAWD